MKNIFKGIGILMLVLLSIFLIGAIGIGIKAIFQPLTVAEKSAQMSDDIVDKVLTADEALDTYHWFKQQYEDINALESKLSRAIQDYDDYKDLLPNDKDKWTRQDREELSRLKTIATGVANMLDQARADYDAKAKMSDKSVFKDDLPVDIMSGVKSGLELLGGR